MRNKKSAITRLKHLLLPSLKKKAYLLPSDSPQMSEIDRFDALKNFLTDNSYESSEGIFYIFPGKLL